MLFHRILTLGSEQARDYCGHVTDKSRSLRSQNLLDSI